MKRVSPLLAALALFGICASVYAVYTVANEGAWPNSWPRELDSLRNQSRTLVGPTVPQLTYEIPMTRRDEFEAAWPHLLKIKSKGAPVFLVRSPYTFMSTIKAGVIVRCPPADTDRRLTPEGPLPGQQNPRTTWMNTNYIELIVDGDIVDLNRIPLPADTPIIDERFGKRDLPRTRPASAAGQRESAEQPSPSGAPATPTRQ